MKAFNKDIVRSIRHSLGRFVAIAAIVALGCGFYAGLRMTAPDMKLAADAYYDGTDLMDIRVVSTLGLTDEDIEALRDVPGVSGVEAAYSADVLATLNDEQYVMRVHSLSPSAATVVKTDAGALSSDDANYLNRLDLVEGRWPTSANECVIFNDRVMSGPSSLGDTVTVDPSDGQTRRTRWTETEFTVVGRVHSPLYVSSTSMGTSTIGSGTIEQFMYVLPEAFDADMPYVEAYVSVEGAAELPADSDAYDDRVAGVVAAIEGIAPAREQARVDGLKAEAQADLDEARAEYEKEEARAKTELADARAELDAAKEELDAGSAQAGRGCLHPCRQREEDQGRREGVHPGHRRAFQAQGRRRGAVCRGRAADRCQRGEPRRGQRGAPDAARTLWPRPRPPCRCRTFPPTSAPSWRRPGPIWSKRSPTSAMRPRLWKRRRRSWRRSAPPPTRRSPRLRLSSIRPRRASRRAKSSWRRARPSTKRPKPIWRRVGPSTSRAWPTTTPPRPRPTRSWTKPEQELADAQKEIDDIEPPDWLVMDRTKNFGVVSFASDADRIDAIASFFPFIFFLVAALVALTTMTRMVEEERMLIGTFKALGYSRARITSKYLIYAALAAGLGSVLGIAVLSQVLPWVIMEAYSIVYYVPRAAMPIDWPIALAAAGLGIGITLLATWAAAAATLRETPAALMQPPAPKAGKRILLERVGPLWRRLSFSWKVTFRNIFRYKRRLVMTCVGIAGCTALLLTGLGLQNSINDIIDVQYGELVDYNVVISEKDDAADDEREAAAALLGDAEKLPVAVRATETSMIAQGADGTEAMTTIVAPSDPEAFKELWHFRTREGHDEVGLTDAGAIVTEEAGDQAGTFGGRRHRVRRAGRFGQRHGDDLFRARDGHHRELYR